MREERTLTIDYGAFGFRKTKVLADVVDGKVSLVAITWEGHEHNNMLAMCTPAALEKLRKEFLPIGAQDAVHDWDVHL